MRLTVVGCSGSLPGPESAASCYLLEAEGNDRTWRILLDLGSGALGPLQRYTRVDELDAIFLSHLHPDHCMDLTGLYVALRYHPDHPGARLDVWGPPDTPAQIGSGYGREMPPGLTAQYDFHTYDGPVRIGPFQLLAGRVYHPVEAYALRVQVEDRVLVYTGDTAWCEELVRLSRGADLLLGESAFLDGVENPEGVHLTGGELGELATVAGAGRLLVTHIPPWHDPQVALEAARSTFEGPTDLARPGEVWEV